MPEDSKSLSEQRYSKYAQGYVESQTHAKGADLERLIELAAPQPAWRALDIATGGGHTALKFAPHVKEVVATDLTPNMLAAAEAFIRGQRIQNVRFERADAEDLPFKDHSFELVTCRIAAHHFPNAAKFVREGYRVLTPGGILLVQDHVLPDNAEAAQVVEGFEKLRDPSHHRAFTRQEWLNLYQTAGFEVEHNEEITKHHQFLTWAQRQGNTQEVITQLVEMVQSAPPLAQEWIQPLNWGTENASFINHHILILGRKPI